MSLGMALDETGLINPQTGAQEFESDSVRAGTIWIGRESQMVLPVVSGGSAVRR